MDRRQRQQRIRQALQHYGYTNQQIRRPDYVEIATRLNIVPNIVPNTIGRRRMYATRAINNLIERYDYDITPVVQNYSFTYQKRRKADRNKPNAWRNETYRSSVSTTNQYLQGELEDEYDNTVDNIMAVSDYDFKEFSGIIMRTKTLLNRGRGGAVIPLKKGIHTVRMRKTGTYNIDKKFIGDSSWDTNNDTCVLDWIIHRYAGKTGFKKLLPNDDKKRCYEFLKNLFEMEDITDGVNIDMLKNKFANKFNIPMYAFDVEENTIEYFKPEKNHGNFEPLIFIIANEHFYPIQDKKKRLSLTVRAVNEKKIENNEVAYYWSNKSTEIESFKSDKEPVKYNVVCPDEFIDCNSWAIDKIEEANTLPNKNTIVMDGNNIKSFIIGETIYYSEPIDSKVKDYYGDDFKGQTSNRVLMDIWKETYETDIYSGKHNSNFNPKVFMELTKNGVKDRVHYGSTRDISSMFEKIEEEEFEEVKIEVDVMPENPQLNKYFDYEVKPKKITKTEHKVHKKTTNEFNKLYEQDKLVIMDIAKAHSYCLYNPIEEGWFKYDIDDDMNLFEENDTIEKGLYYVETNDMILLHQSNWYSSEIVKIALEDGLISKTDIKYKLVCKNLLPKEYFRPVMDKIKEKTEEVGLMKELNNKISGFMGKTEQVERNMGLSCDADEIWRYFLNCDMPTNPVDYDRLFYKEEYKTSEYTRFKNNNVFIEKLVDSKKRNVYLYGFRRKVMMNEIGLPLYIQILDMVNIMIYNLSKKVGGEVIFRKTDEIAILYPQREIEYGENWGDVRKVEIDDNRNWTKRQKEVRHIDRPNTLNDWANYDLKDSSDWKNIIDLAIKNKGLLIEGRAGTGKTYIIKKAIEENYYLTEENTIIMSFTNKASVNIGGSTIHKTLHITNNDKVPIKTMEKLQKFKFCVIDEIGMIKKDLWRILSTLKKVCPKTIFILMGDWRQLPPIDEEDNITEDIFNMSIVKFLCNNSHIELTVRQRYDKELWDYLEKGFNEENWDGLETRKVSVEEFIHGKNICYYNLTRNNINFRCMNYMIGMVDDFKVVEFEEVEAGKQLKKIYVYKGLPLMCIENCKALGIVNSNEFVVKSYNDEKITLNGDFDIEIDYKQLEKLFFVNYASTIHKSQGSTFIEKLYLWNWERLIEDRRVAYTACSRATSESNLVVVE